MILHYKELHDFILSDSKNRKEHISKFFTMEFGIPEAAARDNNTLSALIYQLLRDNMHIETDLKHDMEMFLNETEETEEALPVTAVSSNRNINYDRVKAKEYIDRYWNIHNPSYPSFASGGGDCANFVSQVLYAGGMKWIDDGKYDGYNSYKNWYCKPGATNKDGDRRITLTWKVAASFKNHWVTRAAKHIIMSCEEVKKDIDNLSRQVKIGDIVQFCYSDGKPWHTLAVTDLKNGEGRNDIILASHTMNSNSRSLYDTVSAFPKDYKIRFYFIKL